MVLGDEVCVCMGMCVHSCARVWVLLLSAVDQLIFVGAFKTRLDAVVLPQLLSMLKELLRDRQLTVNRKCHIDQIDEINPTKNFAFGPAPFCVNNSLSFKQHSIETVRTLLNEQHENREALVFLGIKM